MTEAENAAVSTNSDPPILTAEAICPVELLEPLVEDYYLYMFPIMPFPPRTWFLEALRQRTDLRQRSFLALLAGMIGALVGAYPRKPRKRLKMLGNEKLYSNSLDFVKRCEDIVNGARGLGYVQRAQLNAYDAATSYYLYSICAYTYRMTQADLYLSECFAIIRSLGVHRHERATRISADTLESQGVSRVEREVRRRVYWTIFVTVRSGRTLDANYGDIAFEPPTSTYNHPPLPLEIDDEYLFDANAQPRSPSGVSALVGFNINVKLYQTLEPLIALELSYENRQRVALEKHKSTLLRCLDDVKSVFAQIPHFFMVWQDMNSALSEANQSLRSSDTDCDGLLSSRTALEIQKANIHGTYLTLRSHFIEKYWNYSRTVLSDKQSSSLPLSNPSQHQWRALEAEVRAERESIATDLLTVLSSVQPVHMEPNSVSFIMKIRLIAGTLLPDSDAGAAYVLEPHEKSNMHLQEFLRILTGLEKGPTLGSTEDEGSGFELTDGHATDEEEELRSWADLRENQLAFARRGAAGFA
ncbi:MAG: hypothetical protein M1828_006957 [Chrysothrix sp. TS-e1954]|nr:MAG: hypothetical protein M1828_006957 [Chrysothrix sp. TS-e1954]